MGSRRPITEPVMIAATLCAALASSAQGGEFHLTRDGAPAATIVVARRPTRAASFGAWELRHHVQRITGAVLPIISDSTDTQDNRILVGESAATREAGMLGADFKPQEYAIRFLPKTLILMGRDGTEGGPADVSVHGDVKRMRGKFGGAMGFAGAGALTFGDCDFSDDEGALEAWVWLPAQRQPGYGTILRLDGAGPWTYHIVQRLPNTSKIQYVTYDGSGGRDVRSGELAEGWHHLMATYSTSDGKQELLVDGMSQGTAKYSKTTCEAAALKIGGIARPGQNRIDNAFRGAIDEVRVSRVRRRLTSLGAACRPDEHTRVLLHLDERVGAPRDSSGTARPVGPPDGFDDQGTSYAAHDFLERFCGVRWYGPGEIGLVHPTTPTLKVEPKDVRRAPAFAYRWSSSRQPGGIVRTLWGRPKASDMKLFWARLRTGGQRYACNHSFSGFYERFWARDPKLPDVFVEERGDWFAQGHDGKPPQMCFSNAGFVQQVVQDARDYFDGKGLKRGGRGDGDYFALVPMDNNKWCKCATCQAQMHEDHRDHPQFSNGMATDYVFGFCNRVARELRKSHPGKYLSAIAYHDYFDYPRRTRLEPNISVQMCMTVRHWWAPGMKRTDLAAYRDWVAKEKGRPLYLWLYYCFPEEYARRRNFHCFPGFFAHTAAQQIKIFARDGIRGAFLNGIGEQVDTYVTFKLFDDPSLDVEELLDEFFTRYYGAASEPMKRMYLRIEEIFSSPKYYPKEVQQEDKLFHQTEEMAWGYLGTEKRMSELGKLMAQAKQAARGEVEMQRVALFEKGVWEYMVEGRRKYVAKQTTKPLIEKLKSQPPPRVSVSRITGADGDASKVDWAKARVLDEWRTIEGFPSSRKVEARLAHDGRYLYVRLQERLDPRDLVSRGNVWSGDDWEMFFAAERKKPYHQFGVAPSGKYSTAAKAAPAWRPRLVVVSDTSAPGRWVVRVAFPLENLIPGGVQTGGAFYANFYRASPRASRQLAWSPNFKRGFHELSRMGEFTLE